MNDCTITGTAVGNFLNSERSSGVIDKIPIAFYFPQPTPVKIEGVFCSHNTFDHHLKLTLIPHQIVNGEFPATNQIHLTGFICKTPIYRQTPLGKEITDLLIAVHRSNSTSDYLPCIAWGSVARQASNFEIGTKIELWGRVQSRGYIKNGEQLTAYEVSISQIRDIDSDAPECPTIDFC